MNNASKKVAVVAGVGEGLGQAIARRFATDYHVVMFARDLDKLQGYAQQLREAGGEATGMKVDLRMESEIVEALARIEKEIGPIEVAVYNAGAQHRKPLLEIIAKYTNLPVEQVIGNCAYVDGDGKLDVKNVDSQIKWLQEQGFVDKGLDADAIIADAYVKRD